MKFLEPCGQTIVANEPLIEGLSGARKHELELSHQSRDQF
jgi:hypothetical protein